MVYYNHSPYWVSKNLIETIKHHLNDEIVLENILANQILSELNVAEIRTSALPIPLEDLILALGLEKDSIPLYLSVEEKDFLLKIAEMPPAVKETLS